MPESSAEESGAGAVRVAPSIWWILAICAPAVAACLLPPFLADMTVGARWGWLGMATGFAVLGLAASCNRLTVRAATLSQRVVLRSRTMDLDRLAAVRVVRGPGQYTHPWQMVLTDAEGRRMTLRLNGYLVEDRRRLMAALEPFARRHGVRLDGPVSAALSGGLWFPHGALPSEGDPRA